MNDPCHEPAVHLSLSLDEDSIISCDDLHRVTPIILAIATANYFSYPSIADTLVFNHVFHCRGIQTEVIKVLNLNRHFWGLMIMSLTMSSAGYPNF